MPFTIHASVGQRTGVRKNPVNTACNDVIYCMKTPECLFYGLADGQGNRKYGSVGGAVVLHTLAVYVQKVGLSKILDKPFPDEIPFLLTREYRNSLYSLSQQQGYPFTEYASTLLGIAIDPTSGNYMILHLGDGCAIGIYNNRLPLVLSPPENNYSPDHTWLTTSDRAAFHLRVSFGNIRNFQRLVFLTDGARSLCYGKNISARAKQLLADKDSHQILESLKQSHPRDDASGFVLDIHFRPDTVSTHERNRTEHQDEE